MRTNLKVLRKRNHKSANRAKRKIGIRKKLTGTGERPRLTVFRSAKHIYAQVIDDTTGATLASASTMDKDLRGGLEDRLARLALHFLAVDREGHRIAHGIAHSS